MLALLGCSDRKTETDTETEEADISIEQEYYWCCECDCCEESGTDCVPVTVGRPPSVGMDCTHPDCMPGRCSTSDCSSPPHEECADLCWGFSRNPPITTCTAIASHCCHGWCD